MRKFHRTITTAHSIMGEPKDPGLRMKTSHHGATVLDTAGVINDQNHRDDVMIIHVKETRETQSHKQGSIGPATSGMSTIMRTRKLRWGLPALPAGFTKCKYPRDSSYHMTNRCMMDYRNPNHGYQMIFRP
jgi:hypothetical protein